ncbi:MAG: helix-turn-helix domain-containing protein [Patescibacteria group bacterium]|jgi:predicted transcriptional regulator
MLTTLIKLGLSEKEAKVYLAALELAQDTVQNIAKKADVNRPTAYVILDKLMKLGLVSTVEQGKKTLFIAEDPKELENLLKKQQSEIDERKNELKEIMNQLMALNNAQSGKPVVRYFEGADGLMAMDRYGRNLLKKNSEILSIAPIDVMEKYFKDRRQQSLGERIKLGIRSRAIYTHEDGEIPSFKNEAELRDGVFISRDKFPLNMTMTVYPDWGIKLYYFHPEKPHGVVIESKEFAQNMKLIFELAWQGAHK